MGNVIKVRLKKATGVGFSGIMTNTYEEGTEGFVVDAMPQVKDGKLTAGFAVLFPDRAHVAVFQSNELEIIESPTDQSDEQIGLVHLIAEVVSLSFEMKDQGVDLSYLSGMRRKQADKAQPE